MNIGELARRTGASIRSLRYYEAKQLLSSQRGDNGYRFYGETAVERVKAIQFYLHLGLTTNEIFNIAEGCDTNDVEALCDGTDLAACPAELELYKEKLAQVEAQIASLEKVRIYLTQCLADGQQLTSV